LPVEGITAGDKPSLQELPANGRKCIWGAFRHLHVLRSKTLTSGWPHDVNLVSDWFMTYNNFPTSNKKFTFQFFLQHFSNMLGNSSPLYTLCNICPTWCCIHDCCNFFAEMSEMLKWSLLRAASWFQDRLGFKCKVGWSRPIGVDIRLWTWTFNLFAGQTHDVMCIILSCHNLFPIGCHCMSMAYTVRYI
jgi:hypothetical protein